MSAPLIKPLTRPTVVTLVGDVGSHVQPYLDALFVGLDPTVRRGIDVIRPDEARLREAVKSAVVNVQNVITLRRLARSGLDVPHALTQFIIVADGRDPTLSYVTSEIRRALAELVVELGAEHQFETELVYALTDFGSQPRAFTTQLDAGRRASPAAMPDDITAWLRDLFQSDRDQPGGDGQSGDYRTGGDGRNDRYRSGDSIASDYAQPLSFDNAYTIPLGEADGDFTASHPWYGASAHVAAATTDPRATQAPRPPATFAFLFSRMLPHTLGLLTHELLEYILAEAVFGLCSTGVTETPWMQQLMSVTPGVSALDERVGGLGACMIRFPRAQVERYCFNLLGAALLEYWSERERDSLSSKEGRQRFETRRQEQITRAQQFVNGTLDDWLSNIFEPPAPDQDGWPDPETVSEQLVQRVSVLSTLRVDLGYGGDPNDDPGKLLSREEVERLIEGRDPTGESQQDPETHARFWGEVTDQLWRTHQDRNRDQMEHATMLVYDSMVEEMSAHLEAHVDSVWLNPDQGWRAAEAFTKALTVELLDPALESLAKQRERDYDQYMAELAHFETLAHEAEAEVDGEIYTGENDTLVRGIGASPTMGGERSDYRSMYENEPAPADVQVDRYAAQDAALYNAPGADPMPKPPTGAAEDQTVTSAFADFEPQNAMGGVETQPLDPATGGDDAPEGEESLDDEPDGESLEQREERLIAAMSRIVAQRAHQRAQRRNLASPVLGLMVASAPALTLLALTQVEVLWPLTPFTTLFTALGVVGALGLMGAALSISAGNNLEEAMTQHLRLMHIVAARRRRSLEEQLKVYLVNRLLSGARDMHDNLKDWPARLEDFARDMRKTAALESKSLFESPVGHHDILVADGTILDLPQSDSEDVSTALEPVYTAFTNNRLKSPRETWHTNLDGIMAELRASLRVSQGSVIRMPPDEFQKQVEAFMRTHFRVYLSGDISSIRHALDFTRNPDAKNIWVTAYNHAAPLHGAPGPELAYEIGQADELRMTQRMGVTDKMRLIETKPASLHQEWLLIMRARKGGIDLSRNGGTTL